LGTPRGTCGRWLGILTSPSPKTAQLGYLINIFGSPLSEKTLALGSSVTRGNLPLTLQHRSKQLT
jgi:hypothetical protein